jgi:hypothetical protein
MTSELVVMELSTEERLYLLKLLQEHCAYYQMLANHTQCLPSNQQKWKFVEKLRMKLSSELAEDLVPKEQSSLAHEKFNWHRQKN